MRPFFCVSPANRSPVPGRVYLRCPCCRRGRFLDLICRHEAAQRNYTAFDNRQPGRMVGWFS